MTLKVSRQLCSACGDCVEVCAVEALKLVDAVLIVNQEECIECCACVDECTTGALSLVDDAVEPADLSPRVSAH